MFCRESMVNPVHGAGPMLWRTVFSPLDVVTIEP
jgi:hypothetical protein